MDVPREKNKIREVPQEIITSPAVETKDEKVKLVTSYRAKANMVGPDYNYQTAQIISVEEFDKLPKRLQEKFEKVVAVISSVPSADTKGEKVIGYKAQANILGPQGVIYEKDAFLTIEQFKEVPQPLKWKFKEVTAKEFASVSLQETIQEGKKKTAKAGLSTKTGGIK